MTISTLSSQVATRDLVTSPIFLVRGQASRWRYPDERLTPDMAVKLRNIDKSERGTAATRKGYELYLASSMPADEAIVGFKEQSFVGGTIRRVIVTPTKIYGIDGAALADLTDTALTSSMDDRSRFEYIENSLVINNGHNQIQVWDGNLANNVASIVDAGADNPAPWTKVTDIVTHKGLLVVLGTTESGTEWPTLIRWCDLDRRSHGVSIIEWPENNRTFIYEGGSPIVGAVDNWGMLWVFKQDGVYSGHIDMHVGYFEYKFGEEFRGFNPISKMSLVARPDFIFGAAEEGAFILTRDGQIRFLTDSVDDEWRTLNRNRLQYSHAWVDDSNKQVRLLVSSSTNLVSHDRVFVWDWANDEVWFDEYNDRINYARSITKDSGQLESFFGSHEGEAFISGSSEQTDNGIDIPWVVEFTANDLGAPGVDKIFHTITIYLRQKPGRQYITGVVELDQGSQASRTFSLQAGTEYYYNTGLIYNSGIIYEGGVVQNRKYWVNRVAKNISPKFRGSDPVEFLGYSVQYAPLEG